jgi:hypothetical protein
MVSRGYRNTREGELEKSHGEDLHVVAQQGSGLVVQHITAESSSNVQTGSAQSS